MNPTDALKLTDPVIMNQIPWVALTAILVFVLGGSVAWLMFRSVTWYRNAVLKIQAWVIEVITGEIPKALNKELHNGFRTALRQDVREEFQKFRTDMSQESQERLDRHEEREQARLGVALASLKQEMDTAGQRDNTLRDTILAHDKRLQTLEKRLARKGAI